MITVVSAFAADAAGAGATCGACPPDDARLAADTDHPDVRLRWAYDDVGLDVVQALGTGSLAVGVLPLHDPERQLLATSAWGTRLAVTRGTTSRRGRLRRRERVAVAVVAPTGFEPVSPP